MFINYSQSYNNFLHLGPHYSPLEAIKPRIRICPPKTHYPKRKANKNQETNQNNFNRMVRLL